MNLKNICTLFIFLCGISAQASDITAKALFKADSLFEAKKYTESFEIYQHILEEEKQVSPAMLLKMAFIKEGLGNYTLALYYINLYYLQTADENALAKMEKLAEKQNLEGYQFGVTDFIKTIFFKYFNYLIFVLLAFVILLISLMLYKKLKLHKKPVISGVFTVLFLTLLFYTLNFGKTYNKAIVIDSNTYIMDGPSAGANVIDIISKGHRLSVYGRKDVWAKTEWQGKKAYIKSNKIKDISFLRNN